MLKYFKELGNDVIIYGIFSGVSQVSALLLLPVITRKLPIHDFGLLEVLTIFGNFISIFLNLSLPSSVARLFFEKSISDQHQQSLISSLLIFVSLIGFVLILSGICFSQSISVALTDDISNSNLIIYTLLNGYFLALCAIPKILLRINREVLRFNIINLTYSLVTLTSITVSLLFFEGNLLSAIKCMLWASFLQLLLSLLFVKHYLSIEAIRIADVKESLRYSLPLFPAVIVSWVNNQADRIILLSFIGFTAVGVYSAVAKVAAIVKFLTMVFRTAWEPYAIRMLNIDEKERNQFYFHVHRLFYCVFFYFALFLVSFSPELFYILLPDTYFQGCFIFPWLCGAILLHTSGSITNIGILLSKKTIYNTFAATSGAVLNISITVLLVPLFGIFGAAFGTLIAEFTFSMMLLYYSIKLTSVRFDISHIFISLFLYISSTIGIQLIITLVNNATTSIILRIMIFLITGALMTYITVKDHRSQIVKLFR